MPRAARRLQLPLLLALALAVRCWQINTIPPGFHFDEAFEGLEAWRILTDPGYRPLFLTGNFGVPALNAYANAVIFALFRIFGGDAGPTAMRVTAALFGAAGVLTVYGLAQELCRHEPRLPAVFPFFAAASLALMRWHIHFSRIGIEPIIVPALWAGSSWLLLRGWRTGSRMSFAAAGLLLAATLYTYQGAWMIPPLAAALGLHLIAANPRGTARRRSGLALAAVVAVALVLPLLLFFLRHPELAMLRPSQISVVGNSGSSGSVTGNLWATLRMFGPGQTGDLDPRRNLPGAPALNIWQAAPFYLGLALALWRVRRPAYALLPLGLAGLLLPGVLSEQAPHFHRVLGASAPTALLVGLGLAQLWQWGWAQTRTPQSGRRGGRLALSLGAAALLVTGGMAALHSYFVRWAALPDLYYAFDAGLWDVGQWTAAQSAGAPLYLSPRDASHATLAFAWRKLPADAVRSFDGRAVLPVTDAAPAQPERYVVIEQEDFRTRLLLPDLLPAVQVGQAWRDRTGALYAQVYTRPAGVALAPQPLIPLAVSFGDGIELAGYQAIPAKPRAGEPLYVRLNWLVSSRPQGNWTVFVHLLGGARRDGSPVWAAQDSQPGNGSLPTLRWLPGWRVVDEYTLHLPADLPAGSYTLEVGMYQADGGLLPADSSPLQLGQITIAP